MLNSCNNPAEELFNPIIDHLQIVKEVAGSGVYWPQFGVNTLGELVPGKAYFMLVDEDVEVEFPGCTTSDKTPSNSPWRGRTDHGTGLCGGTPLSLRRGTGGEVIKTPITHTIAIPLQAITGISAGSIITIYNQFGLCCGAAISQNQNTAITVFGDDPTTPAIDGMTEGEAMNFRVFNPETGKEFTLEAAFDEQMPQCGTFESHGLSVVKELNVTGVVEIAGSEMNVSVYPNPSSGIFNIRSKTMNGFGWEISNTHGSILATGNNQSIDFAIDLSSYPKGIYYLGISQGELQTVKKLVIQ